jgi:hypothetical protein
LRSLGSMIGDSSPSLSGHQANKHRFPIFGTSSHVDSIGKIPVHVSTWIRPRAIQLNSILHFQSSYDITAPLWENQSAEVKDVLASEPAGRKAPCGDGLLAERLAPDCASLHPGYGTLCHPKMNIRARFCIRSLQTTKESKWGKKYWERRSRA